jgi:hypothetical protein
VLALGARGGLGGGGCGMGGWVGCEMGNALLQEIRIIVTSFNLYIYEVKNYIINKCWRKAPRFFVSMFFVMKCLRRKIT